MANLLIFQHFLTEYSPKDYESQQHSYTGYSPHVKTYLYPAYWPSVYYKFINLRSGWGQFTEKV